jgi:hypothetical protein
MTIFVNLNVVSEYTLSDLVGYLLQHGFNFRKIDYVSTGKGNSKYLVIEGPTDELTEYMSKNSIKANFTVLDNFMAKDNETYLGTFKNFKDDSFSEFFLDKATGKKYAIEV